MTTLPFSSTHRIEDLGGGWMRKDLSARGYLSGGRVRPAFVENATREPAAYRYVLGPLGIGPRCRESGSEWVVLEWVDAPVLWQVAGAAVWEAVAGWAARLHESLADADTSGVPLLVYDAELYDAWRHRGAHAGVAASILAAHERASELLVELPSVILHGDLYASNILVSSQRAFTVWPIDWELMARGPAVLDVAALTSGSWRPDQRQALVAQYRQRAGMRGKPDEWDRALQAARLQICVQWLGMPAGWEPPAWESHDWAAEANLLAARF